MITPLEIVRKIVEFNSTVDKEKFLSDVVQEDFSVIKLNTEKSAPKITPVGLWKPSEGVNLYDVLFPHVSNGFRNKNLHIVTYHVRRSGNIFPIIIINAILFLFRILPGRSSSTTILECLVS